MNVRTIAAAAIIAVAILWPSPGGKPALLSVKEPTTAMQEVVRPVVKVVASMSSIDRLWLQYIYKNAAKVVAADGILPDPSIETTDGLRAIHLAVLSFIWRGMAENQPGKYPGLKDAIESAFTESIGDARRQLTPELRLKAVELFNAIAWAGLGKDG